MAPRLVIPNPGVPGGRVPVRLIGNPCGGSKPVDQISDRAKRYRANSAECKPAGPRKCFECGSKKTVGVGHLDGNEDNGRRSNLAWQCKSCNAKQAHADKAAGRGKRTRQLNPTKQGYPNFAEYSFAAAEHKRGAFDAGGFIIHNTPKDLRRQYADEIWKRRRARGTDRWGKGKDVPF